MPRSDAVPLNPQQPTQAAPQPPLQQQVAPATAPTGRGAAQPLNQPSAAVDASAGGGATTTAPSSPATPGADPLLTQQPNEGWGASILRHLHGASRAIDDLATFGYADKGQGALDQATGVGPTTAQLKSDTNTAYATNPAAVNYGLGAATYAMGPGELKGAAWLGGKAAPVIGKWAGGVLGSAAEGAGAGALGAAGHDEDIGQGAKWGGIFGGLGGTLGVGGPQDQPAPRGSGYFGTVPPSPAMPAARSIPDLQAATTAAYKPNDSVLFMQNEVKPRLDDVENQIANSTDLTGEKRRLGTSTMEEVNNLRARPQLTATDIQQAQDRLQGYNRTPQDQHLAPQFSNALEDILQNGISPNAPTGFAAQTRDAGDRLFGQLQDTKRIEGPEGWMAKAAAGGPDVGSQATAWLPSDEGLKFAPGPPQGSPPGTQGSPLYEATKALGATSAKSEVIPWYVKHFMIAPALGTLANEGFAAATGQEQSPWEHLAADVGVGAGLMGGSALYGRASAALNRAAQQRALGPLRVAASTGQYQAPFQTQIANPLLDAIRKTIYGQGAAGRY